MEGMIAEIGRMREVTVRPRVAVENFDVWSMESVFRILGAVIRTRTAPVERMKSIVLETALVGKDRTAVESETACPSLLIDRPIDRLIH